MRTLAFDGRTGASGDMILGALLAAGADPDTLTPVETELGVRYEVTSCSRSGITATAVDVRLEGGSDDSPDGGDGGRSREHDGGQDDSHEHTHGHGDHAEGSGPTRTYPEVIEIVGQMALPERVETRARAIFRLLGEAEASVHGTDLAETHFHEVGADDAIADIVGTSLLLADIEPDRVVTTPVATGGGDVETSHGIYPVPVPAVVALAERADWSLRGGPVETELLTPTGAAILAHVADGVDTLPPIELEAAGYGAGSKTLEERPNVLRAMVGTTAGGLRRDPITVLETNLDDATPEVLGGLQETLADAGALDVSVLPATMKKSRPGHLVKVIVKPEDAGRVARRLADETGTLGIREHGAGHRFVADRRIETATVDIDGTQYEVDVKVATDESGTVYDVSAEFDDARAVAAETGDAVRTVLRRAEAQIREK
ncbi:MAG: nickel pincer cofactor biosynthesis protein LarC [Halovenus sp.]